MKLYTYKVGERYGGSIPHNDGLHFEIGPDGDMVLLLQFQRPNSRELEALKAGFKSYSYYEYDSLPLACWVFKYPAPVSYVDAPFHAGLYQDDRIKRMLNQNANALTVYVLDGEIIQSMRVVGLHPAAMTAFYTTIRKQMAAPRDRYVYNSTVDDLYFEFTSKEIYERGLIFSHRETIQ